MQTVIKNRQYDNTRNYETTLCLLYSKKLTSHLFTNKIFDDIEYQ